MPKNGGLYPQEGPQIMTMKVNKEVQFLSIIYYIVDKDQGDAWPRVSKFNKITKRSDCYKSYQILGFKSCGKKYAAINYFTVNTELYGSRYGQSNHCYPAITFGNSIDRGFSLATADMLDRFKILFKAKWTFCNHVFWLATVCSWYSTLDYTTC